MDEMEKLIENETSKAGETAADAGQEKRLSWEEILSDSEYRACYDKAVQAIVQKRLKNSKAAEEKLSGMQPMLDALARYCGMQAETMDTEAVTRMLLEGLEKQAQNSEKILRHLQSLIEQEGALRKSVPGFELMQALSDPRFLRLTAPHTGLGLEDAYYALHRKEIGKAAARLGLEALSRSIRSGGERPRELSDMREAGSFARKPGSMSKAEREALKKRIYDARAKNEKVFP